MESRIFDQFLKVRAVSTDTRKITKDCIFFALKGENFNGNSFALMALEQGASMVVVDEEISSDDERIILVDDVLTSLQNLSGRYRQTLKIPFLAITGSNGKTTTKELLRNVLLKKFRVSATIGNLNNHIGVPLTLLSIPDDCEIAIIEMGANHQGEIKSYCAYAAPDFGMITNMGKAHLEGFGGEEGVVKGKKELYDYVHSHKGKLFVNVELEKLKMASQGMDFIPYGFNSGGMHLELVSESPVVNYQYADKTFSGEFSTQLAGAYNLYNIASAIVVGQFFQVPIREIHEAICEYTPDNNRSQLLKTERNLLIMDAYNANPSSLEFALKSLANQQSEKKYFVMGDMRELGESGPEEHKNMLHIAASLGLNGITVGPIFKAVSAENNFPAFNENKEALEYLSKQNLEGFTILVKGSRGIKLEELLPAL